MSQTTSQTCAYEYTVRRGDSFYLIAHRLGVPLKDLLEANRRGGGNARYQHHGADHPRRL